MKSFQILMVTTAFAINFGAVLYTAPADAHMPAPASQYPSNSAQSEAAAEKDNIDPALAPYFALRRTDGRVASVGYRLLAANAPFCDQKIWNAGWQLHSLDDYDDSENAARAYNLREGGVGIAAIAANSPAQRAGFAIGDFLDIDGQQLETAQSKTPVSEPALTLSVKRLGPPASDEVKLELNATCASRFQVEPADKRGASADGELVSITSSLAELTRDDDELAAVLAHEIAHNLLRHPQRLKAANVSRGMLNALTGDAAIIKQTEIEADRLSIWLVANAGYDPQAAMRFWTFYGKKYGKGIFSAPTHYRWKKRVKLFEEEIAKIAAMGGTSAVLAPPLLANPPLIKSEVVEK